MEEGTRPQAAVNPPYALAMVICDAIHTDPGTGKRTILGCFSSIHARKFPAVHPIFAVYVAATDGHGKTPMRLQIVDANEERQPIARLEVEADFGDPRMTLELDLVIANLTFPAAGEYRIQLYAGNELLIERRLVLVQIPGPTP